MISILIYQIGEVNYSFDFLIIEFLIVLGYMSKVFYEFFFRSVPP